jgi:hypothetical protein
VEFIEKRGVKGTLRAGGVEIHLEGSDARLGCGVCESREDLPALTVGWDQSGRRLDADDGDERGGGWRGEGLAARLNDYAW